MFDATAFCRDHNIETAPPYHKHARKGWVNIKCPMGCVGNPGFHLGFHVEKGFAVCFRCGTHWIPKVISAVTGQWISVSIATAKRYTSGDQAEQYTPREYRRQIEPPIDTGPLNIRAKNYLTGRNFDPDEISTVWGVQVTGTVGEYRNRLYIPIILNRRVISYTTRDITGLKDDADKYRACHDEDEVYHHKFSLYGIDQAQGDTCMVVEGCTDAWRIGPGAVGTFGTKFLIQQVALLVKRFSRIFIFYDPDPAGIAAGERLYSQLDVRNIDCEILLDDSGIDPGDMPDDEVKHLRKEIGL